MQPKFLERLYEELIKANTDEALKITVVGSIQYIAKAQPGSSESDPVWKVCKLDETTGKRITWADGNSSYDNYATDLASLNYI